MIASEDKIAVVQLILMTYGGSDFSVNRYEDIENLSFDTYLSFIMNGKVHHTLVQDMMVKDGNEHFHFNRKSLVGNDSVVQCKQDKVVIYRTKDVRSVANKYKSLIEKVDSIDGVYRLPLNLFSSCNLTMIDYEDIK